MTIYHGEKTHGGCGRQLVFKDDDILMPGPSQAIDNRSPDGFNWGYGGDGPAQLALAILFDETQDAKLAVSRHQQFKRDHVANWGEKWEISSEELCKWLTKNA